MPTVYRVQDADGRGPFKPGFSHQWVEERADHENLLPWFNILNNPQRLLLELLMPFELSVNKKFVDCHSTCVL